MRRIVLFLSMLTWFHLAWSQTEPADTLVRPLLGGSEQSTEDSLTYITFQASTMLHSYDGTTEWDTLIKDVVLIQDSLAMYCDSALLKNQQYADAYGNVVIIHEDRVNIFSDSAQYDGVKKDADLYGEVILQEEGRSLFTPKLYYDLESKIATYDIGGTIIDQDRTIISREGIYDTNLKKATLFKNVIYRDSSMMMETDSIIYFTDIEQLLIVAPTYISQDSVEIYCEAGIYRLQIDQGVLSQNVQVKTEKETITSNILDIDGTKKVYTFWVDPLAVVSDGAAKADTIIYYELEKRVELIGNAIYQSGNEIVTAPIIKYNLETEEYETEGRAKIVDEGSVVEADSMNSAEDGGNLLIGNVFLKDDEQGSVVKGDGAVSNDSITKIFGNKRQPEMSYVLTDDTLYIKADTLISLEMGESSDSLYQQKLSASGRMKLMTSNVNGKSGDMVYNKQDSVIILTNDPVIWSDSIQLTADTILIYLSNNEVSKIEQRGNSFILSPDEKGNFNQIKCKNVDSFIEGGEITNTFAKRNVELCYLVLQDGEYKAVNTTKASAMEFTFIDGDIETVKMTGSQESKMFEYSEGMDFATYYLQGYNWRIGEIPTFDMFTRLANL